MNRCFWRKMLLFVLGASTVAASSSFAEDLRTTPPAPFQIRHWTTEDGLPSNTIRNLLQTRDGYLWIGTKGGLARFDGVRFKVFREELSFHTKAEFACHDLAEDVKGRVWIRLGDGLLIYDHGVFARYPAESLPFRATIQSMIASSQGGVWIGTQTDGLKLFDDGQCKAAWDTRTGLARSRVGLLREDNGGRLWMGLGLLPIIWPEVWQRLDPRTGKMESLDEVVGRHIDLANNVQPTADGGLWIFSPTELFHWADGKLTSFPHQKFANGDGGGFTGISEGKDGALWFAPSYFEKLVRFKKGAFQLFGVEDGLADSDIRPQCWDREGNLWIGYGAGGLQKLRPRALRALFRPGEKGENGHADSVCLAPDGALWVGTWSGFCRWENDRPTWFRHVEENREDVRPVLEDHTGQIWLGKSRFGLYNMVSNTISRVTNADLGRVDWSVHSFFEDSRENLWIGTDAGLLRKTKAGFILLTKRDGLSDDRISGILEAPDQSLWIGTGNGGVNHYRNGHFRALTSRDGLLSNGASPLLVEPDGTLWVGTALGLHRIRGSNEIATVVEQQGLYHNEVFCLLDDHAGNYWANSVRGIFRMRKTDLHAVADRVKTHLSCVSFGKADGATTTEGVGDFQPNACRTADGRLFFCTTRNVTVIDPALEVRQDIPPPVVIEQVLADDRLMYSNDSPTESPSIHGPIKLPAAKAHGLEIRYTAPTFVAPEKVRFRYQLHGFDTEWRDANTRRTAFYTALRPGEYRFFVEASNQEGTWSEQPATLAFIIQPGLTQRIWFPWLCAAALLSAGVALGLWRWQWQRKVLLAKQSANLERERARIARDLHDDLGTALTGLALELDVVRKQVNGNGAAEGRLEATAGRTRALAERMREVVWAINPKCDTVSSLAGFLEQQTSQFLATGKIRARIAFPEDIPPLAIDADARHHLALAVREALTNVVRHANATEVTVGLGLEEETLVITIRDNGIGWRNGENGNGLANMRERLEQLGGSFRIQREPQGTLVLLRLPLIQPRARSS